MDNYRDEIADIGGVVELGVFYPQERLPYVYHVAFFGVKIITGMFNYDDALRHLEEMWMDMNVLQREINIHELNAIEFLFPALRGHYQRINGDP